MSAGSNHGIGDGSTRSARAARLWRSNWSTSAFALTNFRDDLTFAGTASSNSDAHGLDHILRGGALRCRGGSWRGGRRASRRHASRRRHRRSASSRGTPPLPVDSHARGCRRLRPVRRRCVPARRAVDPLRAACLGVGPFSVPLWRLLLSHPAPTPKTIAMDTVLGMLRPRRPAGHPALRWSALRAHVQRRPLPHARLPTQLLIWKKSATVEAASPLLSAKWRAPRLLRYCPPLPRQRRRSRALCCAAAVVCGACHPRRHRGAIQHSVCGVSRVAVAIARWRRRPMTHLGW